VLEHAQGLAVGLHGDARLQPARPERHDLARLDVAQELGPDDVEGAGLRRDAVAVAEHPERQGPHPGGVAERHDAVTGHDHRGVGALEPRHHVGHRVLEPLRGMGRQQRRDDLGVRGGAEGDPGAAQLAVERDGVDEVAVVGERDLAPVGAPDGLGVLPGARARRGVAHVPERHLALEGAQLLLVEDLVDEALVAQGHDPAVLRRRDSRRLLPAMLERVEREVGQARDLRAGREEPEHAALVAGAVAIVDHFGEPSDGCGGPRASSRLSPWP